MRVYLALGSNLGDRQNFLQAGVRGLETRNIEIVRPASLYSTEPREIEDQPWFLNTAIEADTTLEPMALLDACLAVERENGRVRTVSKGPRTLDIDIIFYGTESIRTDTLTVPHPGFSSRRFVLVPLAEIASEFIDPRSGKSVRQLLESCTDLAAVQFYGRFFE